MEQTAIEQATDNAILDQLNKVICYFKKLAFIFICLQRVLEI